MQCTPHRSETQYTCAASTIVPVYVPAPVWGSVDRSIFRFNESVRDPPSTVSGLNDWIRFRLELAANELLWLNGVYDVGMHVEHIPRTADDGIVSPDPSVSALVVAK